MVDGNYHQMRDLYNLRICRLLTDLFKMNLAKPFIKQVNKQNCIKMLPEQRMTRSLVAPSEFTNDKYLGLRYFNFEPSFKLRWCRA